MNAPIQLPTGELARRILASVGYQERLMAGRLTSRMGIVRGSVRGLPELHLYLTPDDQSLPAVSLDRLVDWVARVIADPELAGQLRAAYASSTSYVQSCEATYALVGERVAQARRVLAAGADLANGEIAA